MCMQHAVHLCPNHTQLLLSFKNDSADCRKEGVWGQL